MRVIVTGASGQLGGHVLRALARTHHVIVPWVGSRPILATAMMPRAIDLSELDGLAGTLETDRPDAVLHLAAVSKPDQVLADRERGWTVNARATERIAGWCRVRRVPLVFTSTDLVFDGTRSWYREDEPTRPAVEYGRTKVAAETAVLEHPGGLVVRMALMFGPSLTGRSAYFDDALSALRSGQSRAFFTDEFRTPLDYVTAANALIDLLENGATGIVHVAGQERLSRFALMTRVASALGIDAALIAASRLNDRPWPEPRPSDLSLATNRLEQLLPNLRRATVEQAALSWPNV